MSIAQLRKNLKTLPCGACLPVRTLSWETHIQYTPWADSFFAVSLVPGAFATRPSVASWSWSF